MFVLSKYLFTDHLQYSFIYILLRTYRTLYYLKEVLKSILHIISFSEGKVEEKEDKFKFSHFKWPPLIM